MSIYDFNCSSVNCQGIGLLPPPPPPPPKSLIIGRKEIVTFTAYKTHTLVLFLPKQTDNDSNHLNVRITLSKMSIALQNKKYNKSPGADAFSRDFLKYFLKENSHHCNENNKS